MKRKREKTPETEHFLVNISNWHWMQSELFNLATVASESYLFQWFAPLSFPLSHFFALDISYPHVHASHCHGAISQTNTYMHKFYYANLHTEIRCTQRMHFCICIHINVVDVEPTMTIRRHKSNNFGASICSHLMFRRVKFKTEIYKYYKLSVEILNVGQASLTKVMQAG